MRSVPKRGSVGRLSITRALMRIADPTLPRFGTDLMTRESMLDGCAPALGGSDVSHQFLPQEC